MKNGYNIYTETLLTLPLFSELTPHQSKQIISLCKIRNYKKNEILFFEGDNYMGFYILLEGSVKIYKISFEGKESILHLIKQYESFGDVPLFDGGKYPVNAQVIADSVLAFVPHQEFVELIKNNSTICFNILVGFAKKMRRLTQKIEEFSTKEITSRFARYLLEEIKKSGTANLPEPFVKITISKKNLASYLGTITDTLSRLLKRLQNEKIIRVDGKSIFILDINKLKALAR
ncbi:MAG: Crp/Fnr family transcriptional regulator [Ignavibacteriaceae bacterium]|jgi:CRP/FNR family transcriptional regulator